MSQRFLSQSMHGYLHIRRITRTQGFLFNSNTSFHLPLGVHFTFILSNRLAMSVLILTKLVVQMLDVSFCYLILKNCLDLLK